MFQTGIPEKPGEPERGDANATVLQCPGKQTGSAESLRVRRCAKGFACTILFHMFTINHSVRDGTVCSCSKNRPPSHADLDLNPSSIAPPLGSLANCLL